MSRFIVIAFACIYLSGCSDRFLTAPEKVNKAFVPSAEVRVAEADLRALLVPSPEQATAFERQYASRMQLRAMFCAQTVPIGRFDSVATVKGYAISQECLNEQDKQLLQTLGLRRIGLLLAKPALRPLAPLGAPMTVPSGGASGINGTYAAARAGVAVLVGAGGELVSVEIPGGKKIATLVTAPGAVAAVLVSPNGRVAAVRSHINHVLFVDMETGLKLWDTKEFKQFYGWLPEVSAALAADARTGTLALIDFEAASSAPHPIALRDPAWALPVSPSPARVLVGNARLFSLIEHSRSGGVINAVKLKELQIRQAQGVTSSTPPTLMHGGKTIVFNAGRDLATMSLETGIETIWPSGELLVARYAKLSESTVLVETSERDGAGTKLAVFDIDKATLAPVAAGQTGNGTLTDLAGRTGFARRSYQELWMGDTVTTGEPVALAHLVSADNLARQIARLEAVSKDGTHYGDDGQYATVVAAQTMTIAGPSIAFTSPARAAAPVSSGQDASLSAQARVSRMEAVGVYQGSAPTAGARGHKTGHVEVRVRRGKPIILVLSSYEPVRWKVVQEPGAKVVSVLLSGYYQSEVVGAGNARVVNTGSSYSYEAGSSNQAALYRQTALYTGKTIDSFQGKYEGSVFTVGGL